MKKMRLVLMAMVMSMLSFAQAAEDVGTLVKKYVSETNAEVERKSSEVRGKRDSTNTELKKKKGLSADLLKRNKTIEDAMKDLNQQKGKIVALMEPVQRDQKTLAEEISRIEGKVEKSVVDEATLRGLKDEARKLQNKLNSGQSRIDSLDRQLEDYNFNFQRNANANWAIEQEMDRLQSTIDGLDDPNSAAIHLERAKSLYRDMKDLGYDSKFLMMDLRILKRERNLSEAQLQGIVNALDTQLNNTLMGKYVNDQIKKLGLNLCALTAQCTDEKFKDTLDNLLNAKRGSIVEPNGKISDSPRDSTPQKDRQRQNPPAQNRINTSGGSASGEVRATK